MPNKIIKIFLSHSCEATDLQNKQDIEALYRLSARKCISMIENNFHFYFYSFNLLLWFRFEEKNLLE